jgi:hypothetical protein
VRGAHASHRRVGATIGDLPTPKPRLHQRISRAARRLLKASACGDQRIASI